MQKTTHSDPAGETNLTKFILLPEVVPLLLTFFSAMVQKQTTFWRKWFMSVKIVCEFGYAREAVSEGV